MIGIVWGKNLAIRRKQIINASIALSVERNVNIISLSIISKSFQQRYITWLIDVCSKNDNDNRNKLNRNLLNNLREAFILVLNIKYVPENSNRTAKFCFY